MDVGKLRHRLTVLGLRTAVRGDGETTHWFATSDCVWGKVELGTGNNLFSRVGIGARDATITLRNRPLSLFHAIQWNGLHLFLTSIDEEDGFITAKAAVVNPSGWTATQYETGIDRGKDNRPKRDELPPLHFPGVLTEKYLGYAPPAEDGHATGKMRFVLVTPKIVGLSPGDLVTNSGSDVAGTYVVEVCHCLDAYKNEYEIYRKGSV